MVDLHAEDAERLVPLRILDLIRLELDENPTTGFIWSLTRESLADFEIVADEREASGVPGAAALRRFLLRPLRVGRLALEVTLRRHWSNEQISKLAFWLMVRD